MKVVITFFGEFSAPSAAQNRLMRMARALVIHGCTVKILAYARGKADQQIDSHSSGVSISQIFKRDIRGKLEFRKNISDIKFLAASLKNDNTLIKDYETHSPDIIIAYTYFYELARLCHNSAETIGADLFFDLVENFGFTFHRLLNGVMRSQRRFIDFVACKKCNVICVSRGWEKWAQKHELWHCYCPGFLSFSNLSEFQDFNETTFRYLKSDANRECKYFAMMGLLGPRECAFKALLAFFILRSVYNLRFGIKIIGRQRLSLSNFAQQIAWRISSLLCTDIELLGRLSEAEKNMVLHCSDGIILLRSDNKDSLYSFPTRLSEYVLCGSPVYLSGLNNFDEIFLKINIVRKLPLRFWDYIQALRAAISDNSVRRVNDEELFSESEKFFGWDGNGKRITKCFKSKIKNQKSS